MKIFKSSQIKELDQYTIKHEPIPSIELMERAAKQLYAWIAGQFTHEHSFIIIAGPGNNGGDGLALARLMALHGFDVQTWILKFTDRFSEDFKTNLERLKKQNKSPIREITKKEDIQPFANDQIIIDAIFGSGLSRPATGLPADMIHAVNQHQGPVIAIDIPSGLFGEDNTGNNPENIIKASHTLTLQFPKLSFFLADIRPFTGNWHVLPIGLHPQAIEETNTPYSQLTEEDIRPLIKRRNRFDHKGTFGHALLIAGSYGKIGAATLASRACLRSGAGLLTTHVPECGNLIIQTTIPEAMASIDQSELYFSNPPATDSFSAIGAGPGLGQNIITQKAFKKLLKNSQQPMVIDADGLNILSQNKDWLKLLHPNTILTPHPGEFKRLAGASQNDYEQLQKVSDFARQYQVIVVLKSGNTTIATPEGKLFFNVTGNPGMATAGSGDTLTGIILGLMSQGYNPENAAKTGVFIHGLAGDLAYKDKGWESLIASDLIEYTGKAFLKFNNK